MQVIFATSLSDQAPNLHKIVTFLKPKPPISLCNHLKPQFSLQLPRPPFQSLPDRPKTQFSPSLSIFESPKTHISLSAMAMERSTYMYRNADGFEPVVLFLRDDGTTRLERTTCPFGPISSVKLELIGHIFEDDEVCFRDSEHHQLCVWSVSRKRTIMRVDYTEDGLACSFGFARSRDGEVKIVRIWRPTLTAGGGGQFKEISSTFYGNGWTGRRESDTVMPFIPATKELSRFVGGHLYWKGKRSGNVVLKDYNVETDDSIDLAPPVVEPRERKYLGNLSLGHGWAGELSAGLYAHPSAGHPNGQMRLWSLRGGVWEPIRVLRLSTIPRGMRPLVPLLFFQGRDDRLLKLVFVKDGDEVVVTSSTEPGGYRTYPL